MSAPVRSGGPPSVWQHRGLYERVVDALHALPSRFQTSLRIAGISATDLFSLNTPLGAAIEASVVDNLNMLRDLWDPAGQYEVYSFVRQAQVFPDVRLQTSAPGVSEADRILLGIELKGWFLLAKEGEPSFRYKASPNVCAAQDLLCVFPWTLDEVISGSPRLLRPFIEEARYAAEHRNHYWEVLRGATGPTSKVSLSAVAAPYPTKGQQFNDKPISDSGGNFGRVARGNIMADFIKDLMEQPISGIPIKYWHRYLSIFSEGVSADAVDRKLAVIRTEAENAGLISSGLDAFDRLQTALRDLVTKI